MKKLVLVGAFALAACSNTSCVARGTMILTPRGKRAIEDLEVGDLVFAVDEDTRELHPTPITAIQSAHREVGMLIAGEHGLRLTSDHPVYCPIDQAYAPAGDWFLGKRTQVLTCDGIVPIERVETYVDVTQVFDISVEHELHNFVAGGVVVHNKDRGRDQCELEGEFVFEADPCECEDGSQGGVFCSGQEAACFCPDSNNAADMTLSDLETNNAKPDAGMPDGGSTDLGAGDAGADSGMDAAMVRERGDCVADDDCAMDTWMCVAVGEDEPGAHYTCQADVVAEPGCATIEAPDECCVHTDCTDDPSGTCVIGPIFYCGGVAPQIANVCLYDECAANADCGADEICMPPRALGEPVSRCVQAECGTDADCTTGAGGECHMFRNPCNGRVSGFLCTYDDSECRTNDDCPDDPGTPGQEYCSGNGGDGDTVCASFTPPP